MKNLLVLLVMFITTISISAQERNELQKIDLLQYKLDKLQHDYDFLDCSFKLYRLATDLRHFNNNINTKSSEILIKCYHSRYDSMLYRVYKDHYDASEENLTSSEHLAFSTIMNIQEKMDLSTFSETALYIILCKCRIRDSEMSLVFSLLLNL